MDREYAVILLPPISWILWSLGGKKHKWWRRLVLPAVYGITALIYGWPLHTALALAGYSAVAFYLGYGEHKTWAWRFGIGCIYGSITTFLGLTPWQLVIPAAWLFMFWASNSSVLWLKKMFTWKVVEGSIGALIGIALAVLL